MLYKAWARVACEAPELVVALATSCGFTLALFFARSVLPIGAVQQQIAVGALGTVAGIAVTLLVGKVTCVGRFARPASGGRDV